MAAPQKLESVCSGACPASAIPLEVAEVQGAQIDDGMCAYTLSPALCHEGHFSLGPQGPPMQRGRRRSVRLFVPASRVLQGLAPMRALNSRGMSLSTSEGRTLCEAGLRISGRCRARRACCIVCCLRSAVQTLRGRATAAVCRYPIWGRECDSSSAGYSSGCRSPACLPFDPGLASTACSVTTYWLGWRAAGAPRCEVIL